MPQLSTQPLPKKFRSIQLLRSLACLLVVLFHCSMQLQLYYHQSLLGGFFGHGYGGVDLFFVISGFVIAHSSTANLNQPTAFWGYWYKRVTRIFPIYWAILLPVAIGTAMIGSAKFHAQSFSSLVAEWAPILVLWPNHEAIIGVSWTLSYELYFYVVFSFLILSSRFRMIPAGIILLSLLVLIVNPQTFSTSPQAAFLVSPFNLEFGAGALAWFLLKHIALPSCIFWCMIILALGVVLTYLPTVTNENHTRRVLIFGSSSFLLIWALTGLEKKQGMSIPVGLDHIGDASYMLYLIHFPILVFANKLLQLSTNDSVWISGLNIALVGVVVIVSVYMHWHIEKPLLYYLKRQSITVSTLLVVINKNR